MSIIDCQIWKGRSIHFTDNMKKWTAVIFIALVDRVIKFLFLQHPVENVVLVPNVLLLDTTFNSGIAFGLLDSFGHVLTLIICALIIWASTNKYINEHKYRFPFVLIIGGAIGNVLDRFYYHAVVDYINIPFFSIFNFADMCITAGVIYVLVQWIRQEVANNLVKKHKE